MNNIEVFRDPFIIKINNCFGNKTERSIFKEALENRHNFNSATINNNGEGVIDEGIRKNLSCYYDEVYSQDRTKSILLESIMELFRSSIFRNIMSSSQLPFCDFYKTNHHETQVSRYGDESDFYRWHVDSLDAGIRKMTFVYYFGDTDYEGGEIKFSTSPISDGQLIEKDNKTHTFKPETDTGFIFAANVAHTVLPTKSSIDFEKGRFSVNCWIGEA